MRGLDLSPGLLVNSLGDPLAVDAALGDQVLVEFDVFLPQYGCGNVGVEVSHDVVVCESGLEDGGDVGRIVYGGWMECEWHGGLDWKRTDVMRLERALFEGPDCGGSWGRRRFSEEMKAT